MVTTEYNIEGNPIPEFKALVLAIRPTQVTLVPDAEDAITLHAGWDTVCHASFLKDVIAESLKQREFVLLFLSIQI